MSVTNACGFTKEGCPFGGEDCEECNSLIGEIFDVLGIVIDIKSLETIKNEYDNFIREENKKKEEEKE